MPKLEVLCSHVFKKPITGVRKDSFDHHLSQDLRADIENSYRNKMELHKKKIFISKTTVLHGHFLFTGMVPFCIVRKQLEPFKSRTCLHLSLNSIPGCEIEIVMPNPHP